MARDEELLGRTDVVRDSAHGSDGDARASHARPRGAFELGSGTTVVAVADPRARPREAPLRTCIACEAHVDETRDVRWRKDGYDIVRCPVCGLLARATLPTEAELADLYSVEYFRAASHDGQGYLDYLGDAHVHRETARRRLRRLERFQGTGSLLDVGAAAGFFVAE